MTRMTFAEFQNYLCDTIKEMEPNELEEIGEILLRVKIEYVINVDGFEVGDE